MVGYDEDALAVPFFKPGKHGNEWPLFGATQTVRRIACFGKQLHIHPGRENDRSLAASGSAQNIPWSYPLGIDGFMTVASGDLIGGGIEDEEKGVEARWNGWRRDPASQNTKCNKQTI